MKDSRLGESLWDEWDGHGYNNLLLSGKVFFTEGHVDLENELVRRALASTLQRDGISDSLADGFRLLENAAVSQGWMGYVDMDVDLNACSQSGFTNYGDLVDDIQEVTWVEF